MPHGIEPRRSNGSFRMKLLFVNYEFPPFGGGAAKASLAAATELAELGHNIDFLTVSPAKTARPRPVRGLRVFAVNAYRRGPHEASMVGAMSFVAAAALRLPSLAAREQYDAYHYYFGLPTGLLALVPGPHQRRPYVISLRGSDVPGYDSSLTPLHSMLLPVTRRIWARAGRVVANSYGLRTLASAAIPQQAIDVIHNGVDLPAPTDRSTHVDEPVRLLAVTRLIHRKDIDCLLHAVRTLDRGCVALDIAGEGPDRERLEGLVRSLGLTEQVRFHGLATGAALAELYCEADVFVLNSIAESCSMALLDALAAGLPVVATDVGGTPELVEHGINGLLVTPGDAMGLAAALRQLVRDRQFRSELGLRGRARATSRHGWRAVAQKYEAIFLDLLKGWRSTAPRQGIDIDRTGTVPVLREP
jgi:glycosyltransferase involved in cell wall biosynthesis